MSKKIFFIVLTCCLLVATFCVSFAGAPQVQSAPADIRAVLDRPDCAAAPLIVPPVVEPLGDYVISPDDVDVLPYLIEPFDGDLSYVPSGVYYLSPIAAFNSSYGFVVDADDIGSFTILSFSSTSDVSSSVSLFSLLYSDYRMADITVDGDSVKLFLEPVSGGAVEVIGDDLSLYIRFNDAYNISGDDLSDVRLYTLVLDSSRIVSPIVDTLVSGLRALGANVGRAFSTMANAIFINTDGTGLSTFGILVVVFAAISLGLSLTRWVLNFVTSWGKRNR